MRITTKLLAVSSLLIMLPANALAFDLPASCIARFQDGGAVPQADDCYIKAAVSSANLGNYYCTASSEYAEAYCASPLPFYDEDEEGDDSGDGSDGMGTSGDEDSGDDSDGGADGTGSSGDDDNSDTGSDDAGTGGDTGSGEDLEPLPEYVDPTADSDDEPVGDENTWPTMPAIFDFVFGSGFSFSNNPVLEHYSLVAAFVQGVNLTTSAIEAQETCDTSLVYQNVLGITNPLLSNVQVMQDIYGTFSDFVDTSNISTGVCQ